MPKNDGQQEQPKRAEAKRLAIDSTYTYQEKKFEEYFDYYDWQRDSKMSEELSYFVTSLRSVMGKHYIGTDMDFFRMNPGKKAEHPIERLSFDKAFREPPGEYIKFWKYMYEEACQGRLLLRVPGEEYPRRLKYKPGQMEKRQVETNRGGSKKTVEIDMMGDGKLLVSDFMVSGIDFQDELPPRPGRFIRFLHALGITTKAMEDYLRAMENQNSAGEISRLLQGYAGELNNSQKLKLERLPQKEREAAIYRQNVEKGPFSAVIKRNNRLLYGGQCFIDNISVLADKMEPQPQRSPQFTKGFINCAALMMSVMEISPDSPGHREVDRHIEGVIGRLCNGHIRKFPQDLGVETKEGADLLLGSFYKNVKTLSDAANSGDVKELAKQMTEALHNTRRYCLHQIKMGKGVDKSTLSVVAGISHMMHELRKDENQALWDAIMETGGDRVLNTVYILKGICDVTGTYLQGKEEQSHLLGEGSQPEHHMSMEDRRDAMELILIGNQAEAVLTGEAKGEVYAKLGKNVDEGRDFVEVHSAEYEDSSMLDAYEEKDLDYTASLFAKESAIININQKILGENAKLGPGKLVKQAQRRKENNLLDVAPVNPAMRDM